MSESENKKTQQVIELDFDFDFAEVQAVSEVFFKESEEILSDLDEQILRLESHPHDEVLVQGLFRKVHTLKGSVGAVPGGQLIGSLAHEFETLLDRLRMQKNPPPKACIEIFLHSSRLLKILAENLRTHRDIYPEELSEVIELIARYGSFQLKTSEELSVAPEMTFPSENQDVEGRHGKDGIWLSKDQLSSLTQISGDMILLKNSFQIPKELSRSLNLLSDQFQEILDKAQKIPLTEAFSGLSTLTRQAAYELKKDVRLEDFGFELEIDKQLASDLYKALIHMVRNSIDHGIETPQERTQVGKSRQGVLKIKVEERISVIHCEIKDDGKGLDKDRILQRALEKGLTNILESSQMSEANIFAFIFHPGFSTKKAITTISGRGVGMDVVKSIVTKYGGHIEVQSKTGEGSTIHLSIPVPRKLHVEHCLLGEWQDFSLAFSLSEISHISSCDELQVTDIDGLRFCQFDGKTVPLLTLEEIYKSKMSVDIDQVKVMSVVFLKSKDFHLGLLVDRIQHQADLLIKAFGNLIKCSPGFKGNSVLADGQITYVVDSAALCGLLKREKL